MDYDEALPSPMLSPMWCFDNGVLTVHEVETLLNHLPIDILWKRGQR